MGKKDLAGQRLGWTGFTWDNHLFPEPKMFLDWYDTTINLQDSTYHANLSNEPLKIVHVYLICTLVSALQVIFKGEFPSSHTLHELSLHNIMNF